MLYRLLALKMTSAQGFFQHCKVSLVGATSPPQDDSMSCALIDQNMTPTNVMIIISPVSRLLQQRT